MKPAILVTGGAGYIGSHAVLALIDGGWRPVVLDDLSTGVRAAIPQGVPLVVADAGDKKALHATFAEHDIRAVMHFAGSVRVEESVANPLKYYRNNSGVSRDLIDACVEAGVERLVFSSTAATYGIPETSKVTEDAPTQPINPYGWSKLMTEQVLKDSVAAYPNFKVAILRYFNVAGADPGGRCGQRGENATHLIKVACEVAAGKRPAMQIFGTDYDTPDGTCVRDFIHVSDLAEAHVAVLNWLAAAEQPLAVMNCGYGRGFSVREVLQTVERLSGRPLTAIEAPRRAGDPPMLISDPSRLMNQVGWQPRHNSLETIIQTALNWEHALSCAA